MTFLTSKWGEKSTTNNSTSDNLAGTTLVTTIDSTQTTGITLSDSTGFPASGTVLIGTEFISYTSISSDILQGVTRDAYGSTAAIHTSGDGIGEVFIGTGEQNNYPTIGIMSLINGGSSFTGVIRFQFSGDGTNWDSTYPVNGFTITSGIPEFHTAVKLGRYFRTIIGHNGTSATTTCRINTYYGLFPSGKLPLNQSIGDDSDSTIVRAINTGANPVGTYTNTRSSGYFSETTTTLNTTTTTNSITNIATTITVNDVSGFFDGELLKINDTTSLFSSTNDEFVTINGTPVGNVITIDRAQLGTSATTHANGAVVSAVYDSGTINTDGYTQFQIELYSDVNGKLNSVGYPTSDSTTAIREFVLPYSSSISDLISNSFPVLSKFFRFMYSNNVEGQSSFSFKTKLTTTGISGQTLGVEDVVVSTMVSNLQRSVTTGKQPDGDYVNTPADGEATSTSTILGINESYTSSWVDTDGWNSIQIFISSDVVSVANGIQIQFTDNVQATTPNVRGTLVYEFNDVDITTGFKIIKVPPTLDGYRIVYTNGTTAQTSFYLSSTLKVNSSNLEFNKAGAIQTGSFYDEVALGNVSNYFIDTKFGRVGPVNTTETPLDIWEQASISSTFSDYTGMPTPYSSVTMNIVSTDANDTAAGTGARTVRVFGLRTTSSTVYTYEDVTLNGTTAVTLSDTWFRVNRAYVLTAGSGNENAGRITIFQNGDTNAIYASIFPNKNQSSIGCYTVPFGKRMLIKKILLNVTLNGTGDAEISLRIREQGGVFRAISIYDIQTGSSISDERIGGIIVPSLSDIKLRCEAASDNGTIINGSLEYILINE